MSPPAATIDILTPYSLCSTIGEATAMRNPCTATREQPLFTVAREKSLKQQRPSTAAAAAAKSLQSCPTLCDPRDGSPPGSAVPGILQARTLEWVAIPFSNA